MKANSLTERINNFKNLYTQTESFKSKKPKNSL